jgi:hypothetical protein
MPKSSKAKLAYQAKYNKQPEELAKRIKNNAARQEAIREGRAKVGDGTQVDHVKPLDAGGTNAKSNLRVIDREKNAAWRKKHPKLYGNE